MTRRPVRGATLVEYTLLLSAMVVGTAAGATLLGSAVRRGFSGAATALGTGLAPTGGVPLAAAAAEPADHGLDADELVKRLDGPRLSDTQALHDGAERAFYRPRPADEIQTADVDGTTGFRAA